MSDSTDADVDGVVEKLSEPGDGTPHPSDNEMDLLDVPEPKPDEVPGVGDSVAVVPPVAAAPLPDPMVVAEPVWDVGVQKCEVAPTGRSVCFVCKAPIAKGSARLDYMPNLSTHRYLHTGCIGDILDSHKPHSNAMLRYQQSFGVGAHNVVVQTGIADALSKL